MVIPSTSPTPLKSTDGLPQSSEILWGLYDITIDHLTGAVDIVPVRAGTFEVNVTKFLQPPCSPSSSLAITLASGTDVSKGYIVADVGITHPFPNSKFMGFDVKGVFMPPSGGHSSKIDPDLTWASYDQARLLNADGYTRWWNESEFMSYDTIFGYTEGVKAPHGFTSTCTLNPYKYFAYGLGMSDPLTSGTLDMTERGSFRTTIPSSAGRSYIIQFPPKKGVDFRFKYAITANWSPPNPGSPSVPSFSDFPITANQAEAVAVEVFDNGSTAYWTPSTTGGDLKFKVRISDWQGGNGPGYANGVSSVMVESPTLFDTPYEIFQGAEWWIEPDGNALCMYCTIPNVSPTTTTGQDVLVNVYSYWPTSYAPPIPGYGYPTAAQLAAYQVWEAPIK
jgi:hypothetical protein